MKTEHKQASADKIPEGWEVKKMINIATLQRGYDLPARQRKKGEYPVIGSNGIVGYHNIHKVVGPGVVIGRSGTLGKVYYSSGDYWPLNTSLYVKEFHGNVAKFIYYFFQHINISRFSAGTGVPTLNRNLLHPVRFTIPRTSEQRKIAEILSIVDDAIHKADEAIAKAERLKKGLMQELLTKGIGHKEFKNTKIGRIPKEWEIVKVGDVAAHVGSGLTPRGGASTYLDHGIPFIRSQNVFMNKLSLSDVAYISVETHREMFRSMVQPGDVLLNITGASIGRVATVPESVQEANVNQHVCRLRFLEVLSPKFASYYLSSNFGQSEIMRLQGGATRQGLNYQQVRSLSLLLPQLPEQQNIADVLSTIDRGLDLQSKRRETLDQIKKGLMNDLLTAKRRVKV